MSDRKVVCSRLGKELPGLVKPPFAGPVGQQIFNSVSADAWAQWKDMQIKIINEYRLNMADPKQFQTLIDQMMTFLNLKEGTVAEVENAARGGGSRQVK